MKTMLRFVVLVAVTMAIIALTATPSAASQPTFVQFDVDRTFISPAFSRACGFTVAITTRGTYKGTVFVDGAHNALREVDSQPGATITVIGVTSGKTFEFPYPARYHYDYTNGAAPGSRVTVTITGLTDKVPGMPADAGRAIYADAVVLYVDSNGVPILDFGAPTAMTGSTNDPASAIAALCAALAP